MRTSFQIVRAVTFALILREFLGRFMKRRMGAVWTIFEPFLHVFLLTLFFTYVRGRSITGLEYPIYLITGLVPFLLYRNVATRLMDAVNANRGLFAYKQIKPFDTFFARTVVETFLHIAVYALLIFIFGWVGFSVGVSDPLTWIAVLLTGLVFSFSLGILLAILVNALPDTKTFVGLLFFPLYFISGVVYPPSGLPQQYLQYLLWNPFLHVMEITRSSIFENYHPVMGISFMYLIEVTSVFLFCALGLYRVRRFKLLSI